MFETSRPLLLLGLGALAALVPTTASVSASSLRVLEAGGVPAEAAALLMSEESGGSLTLQAMAIPRGVHPRGEVELEVILQVRGADVLDAQGDRALLQVFTYALDERNTLRGSLLKVIEVEDAESRRRVAAGGIEYSGTLRLAPGRYSLRMLARNPVSSAVGLRRLTVEIPSGPTAGTILFQPLFDEPAGAWVRAPDAVAGNNGSGKMLVAGGPRSVWPVLSGDSDRPYEILAFALGDPTKLKLELSPRTEGGGWGEPLLLEVPVLAKDRPAPDWSRVSSHVPKGRIPPGNYRVRLVSESARPVRSADLPLFSSPRPAEGPQIWASLLERPEQALEDSPAAATNRRAIRLGVPREQLRADLRQVLVDLGDGRREPALRRLTTLQEKAVRGSGLLVETLRALELGFIRTLTHRAPESLAPIVDLYLAVYLDQLAAGKRLLSSHNRLMLTELAALEVSRRDSPAARRHAADALTRLGTASTRRLTPQSERLYRQSLEIDPANEVALLSLITGYERRADYPAAIHLLQQLLRERPEHREGKLRMAVNLNRTREPRSARRLLVDLTKAGPADWIRAVAYQELASHYLGEGEIQEVRQVLGDARAVFPDDEKLLLLEAFTLDAQQQPRRAGKLLELGPKSRESPRFIYGQGPAEILNRVAGPTPVGTEGEMAALREALRTSS